MATNLRLPEQTARGIREIAERRHMSQQAVIREALEHFIADDPGQATPPGHDIPAPLYPFDPTAEPFAQLAAGQTTLRLLDRDERI